MAGTGIFNQSGGTNYVTDELDVGGADPSWNAAIMATPLINTASGVYTLSSGLLLTSQCGMPWVSMWVCRGPGSSRKRAEAISQPELRLVE